MTLSIDEPHGTALPSFRSRRSARKTISTSLSFRASSSTGTATGPSSKSLASAASRALGDLSPSCLTKAWRGPGGGVDAVDDQQGRADELLRRREDVEEDGVVDRLAREVGQDDQLAGLEERLAVLVEEDLRPPPRAGPGRSRRARASRVSSR